MNAPCKDCKTRKLGCHAICKQYSIFRKEKDQELIRVHCDSEAIRWSDKKIRVSRSRLGGRR